MRVLVLNGPNLNLLGTREPDVYGTETLADLEQAVAAWGEEMGIEIETLQSNHEGTLIDAIQRSDIDGIVLNPAAYTHTSRAIADAISAVTTPVVEVHISNIKEREAWRAESLVSEVCSTTIYGRGIAGYRDALRHLLNRAAIPFETVRYGPDPDHDGDLRRGGANLAVIVHGGFWRSEWTKDTTESIAVDLTRHGFTTWNIEYRRLQVGGGWPASADDVLAALDFIPALGIEPRRVVVFGHSAGGYLAMWAAQRSTTNIDQVVALAPVVDLERHSRSQMFGHEEAQRLIDSGAPVHLDPGDVQTLLVHGESDRHVPSGHSAELANSHGLDLLATPTGHFELLDPSREPWPLILEALTNAT
jgi:3-dehydroquinate dehydratase-2